MWDGWCCGCMCDAVLQLVHEGQLVFGPLVLCVATSAVGVCGTAGALGLVCACETAGAVVELVHVGLLILWCSRCTVSDCLCCGTWCSCDCWCSRCCWQFGAGGACGATGAVHHVLLLVLS